MDAKEPKGESAIAERSSDGGAKFSHTAAALQYDRAKPCPDFGQSTFKVDGQGARPCAVIGPDRVVAPAHDAFPKKAPIEPWLSPESLYRRPPEYPHKMAEYQDPTRNISPRQTFQENMQRIIMPPGYNTLKVNDDPAYSSKNNKLSVPLETKYCDVPYNVNPMSSDQKNLRNPEHSVSNVNPLLVRSLPHAWPPGSVSVRPMRPYGVPDVYQYPDYSGCTGPRPPQSRPHSSSHEEPSLMYTEPYYHEGNIRYKPYPNIKERYPQTRYEYLGSYSNPYHSTHPFATHKYELPKTMSNHPYPGYPQTTLKYTDRVTEPVLEGYQRSFNQQGNYGVPFRSPVIHSPYRPVPGNPLQNKLHPYPSDGSHAPTVSNKLPYDPNNKIYFDYENSRPKTMPMNDNFYLSEMSRPYHAKNPIILPNYPPTNMPGMNPHSYIQLKNYEYARFKSLDPSLVHNSLTKLPMQFSPSTLAISPADSNASNDTVQTHGTSREDCGYVSQSSVTSGSSMDNRLPMDMYGRHDYRFGPIFRGSSSARPDPNCNQMSKSKKDIRQFISSWNEGDDENVESSSKRDITTAVSIEANSCPKPFEQGHNQEQLYVLGLVNVPSEELGKYEHIQKVSKLPENIKGYNSLELLNQFEEAIESSNMNNINPPIQKEINNVNHIHSGLVPRAVSPLDVEAKISQSVIHKEVGCNFEIKPCSPKMLNVQMATPVQTILNERIIEKVANPQSRKSPIILQHENDNIDNVLNNKSIKYPLVNTGSSCKMINSQLLSEASTVDHLKTNYSLQDLESNLGVCLASLPRLDNDIELNFPEVNQQFINANKTESVITKSFSKDLPALDLERTEINTTKCNGPELDMSPHSPKAKIETDKEFSRLSKYRKIKKNITEQSNIIEAKAQATRVDSVIIKNPDNNRMYEEDSTNIFRSGGYLKNDSQECAINLATQTKNSQVQNELDKKHIISNQSENTHTSPSNFIVHPKEDDIFSKTSNRIEPNEKSEVNMQTEDLSVTFKDVSNQYLNKDVLAMPMNLSPQTKYLIGMDEEIKNNKMNVHNVNNENTTTDQVCAVSSPKDRCLMEEKHKEELKHEKCDGEVKNLESFDDTISPHSDIQDSTKVEHVESRLSSENLVLYKAEQTALHLNSDTLILTETENVISQLNDDSQVLPKFEEPTVSSLNSNAAVLFKNEECTAYKSNSTNPDLSQTEECTVSSLHSYSPDLDKIEECTVSRLDSGNLVLSASEEHISSSLKPDSPDLSILEHVDSGLNPNTSVSSNPEECTVSILNSDRPALSEVDDDTTSREDCNYVTSNNLCNPEKNELNLSCIAGINEDTIEQGLPRENSELLKIDETQTSKLMSEPSAVSTTSRCLDDRMEPIANMSSNDFCNKNSFSKNSGCEDSDMLTQHDEIHAICLKNVDVYVPKLKRNKNIFRQKRSTESMSTTVLKDRRMLNSKKSKFTLHNDIENSLNQPIFDTQKTLLDVKTSSDNLQKDGNVGTKNANETNLSTTSLIEKVSSKDRQHEHTFHSLECESSAPDTTTVDLSVKLEKNPEVNKNICMESKMEMPNESALVTPVYKIECSTKDDDSRNNSLETTYTSVSLDTNEPLNNAANNRHDRLKNGSINVTGKSQETELFRNAIISHNRCSQYPLTTHHSVKKELFSPRFQSLLTYSEGKIIRNGISRKHIVLHKLDSNLKSVPKYENSQATHVVQKSDEKRRSNSMESVCEKGTTEECFLTEIKQNVNEVSSTYKRCKIQNALPFLKCTSDHLNKEKLDEKERDKLKAKYPVDKIISSNIEPESEHSENLCEKQVMRETGNDNFKSKSKGEKINDVNEQVSEIRFDKQHNVRFCTVENQTNKTKIADLLEENINEIQKHCHKDINYSTNQDELHNTSDSTRSFLKRSLSDSALDVYDGDADESSERNCLLLSNKRKCCKRDNIEESDFINIIQNSRRNSISTLCTENISFCILIDDNCIIAEENYDQEDITEDNTESTSINDVQEKKGHEIKTNLNDEDPNLTEEEEKSWVENVGYEEIIETDDIAENIIIGEPTSPKDTDSSDYESDDGDMGILNSAEIDHTNKVKHIYGDNMCFNDSQLVDALYRTPQMDVNKKLMDRDSQKAEITKYYDSDSLEMLLAEPINNNQQKTDESDQQLHPSPDIPCEETSDHAEKDRYKEDSSLSVPNTKFPNADNKQYNKSSTSETVNETSMSCESSVENLFSYEQKDGDSYTSSSPEVSSTTSEEKNSCILLKISKYKGSRISEVNNLNDMHFDNRKENSCKFTEKEYLNPNYNNNSHRPLITKAAQKYIPPLKETIPDLKVKLTLPQTSLLKLKENKVSKEEPKLSSRNLCCNNNNMPHRKDIPKKVKPKFEDVLKNIDEVQFQKHKDKNKKSRNILKHTDEFQFQKHKEYDKKNRNSVPKVVIKKSGNGSHYASSSSSAKTSFNPDLTGRKWQPWVFIEKNLFVDKMALRNKTKAVFSHRKQSFVLDEKKCKYKSISSAKFIISQPKLNEFSTGNLKYTIKLRHSY